MNTPARTQFQRLSRAAQRAALWRLAWSGLTVEQIAERTGWSVAQVRGMMAEESMPEDPWRQHAGNWTGGRQSLPA